MTEQEVTALKAKIADAESSYHDLALGRLPRVFVDQNGERVEFTATNRAALYAYINELKSLLPCADAGFAPRFGRPIGYLF